MFETKNQSTNPIVEVVWATHPVYGWNGVEERSETRDREYRDHVGHVNARPPSLRVLFYYIAEAIGATWRQRAPRSKRNHSWVIRERGWWLRWNTGRPVSTYMKKTSTCLARVSDKLPFDWSRPSVTSRSYVNSIATRGRFNGDLCFMISRSLTPFRGVLSLWFGNRIDFILLPRDFTLQFPTMFENLVVWNFGKSNNIVSVFFHEEIHAWKFISILTIVCLPFKNSRCPTKCSIIRLFSGAAQSGHGVGSNISIHARSARRADQIFPRDLILFGTLVKVAGRLFTRRTKCQPWIIFRKVRGTRPRQRFSAL